MKINNIIYKGTLLAASVAMLVSCSDFLDTMPDNRTTMDRRTACYGLSSNI